MKEMFWKITLTTAMYRVIVVTDMKIQYCDFSLIQSGGDTKDL